MLQEQQLDISFYESAEDAIWGILEAVSDASKTKEQAIYTLSVFLGTSKMRAEKHINRFMPERYPRGRPRKGV